MIRKHQELCRLRQLPALHSTVGQDKAAVLAARFADIAPDAEVIPLTLFFDENTLEKVPFSDFDFLVDAIDSVPSKLLLIETATRLGIPIISAMGAGNKLDASAFRVGDIYETSVCPLARVMRRLLRQRGIPSLRVVWSTEPPRPALVGPDGRTVPASAPHVPPACGMVLAGDVILKLSGVEI